MHSRFITSFSFPWSHQTKCCFCQFRCFEYPVQTESNLHPIWISNHDFFETPPLHLFIRDLLGVFLSNGTRGVSPPTSLHVSVAATLQWLFCLVSNWDFKLKEAWVELRSLWWGERMKMRDSWGAKKLCTAAHTAVPLPLPLCVKKQLGKPQVNGFRMKFFLKQRKT